MLKKFFLIICATLLIFQSAEAGHLRQAELFSKSAEITGIVLTKLDSTAKGLTIYARSMQKNLQTHFLDCEEFLC